MKKILYFILCISTLFILASCKKNEPVGRVTSDFLSDFTLDSTYDYEQYDAIIKDQQSANKVRNFYKAMRKLEFSFTTNKKVTIKTISFRMYNHSETEMLKVLVNEDSIYSINEDKSYSINYFNEYNQYTVEELKPGEFKDVTLNFDTLTIKKKNLVRLMFGFTLDSSFYGIDYSGDVSVEDRMTALNRLDECAGICNFKIDYMAYIKI